MTDPGDTRAAGPLPYDYERISSSVWKSTCRRLGITQADVAEHVKPMSGRWNRSARAMHRMLDDLAFVPVKYLLVLREWKGRAIVDDMIMRVLRDLQQ